MSVDRASLARVLNTLPLATYVREHVLDFTTSTLTKGYIDGAKLRSDGSIRFFSRTTVSTYDRKTMTITKNFKASDVYTFLRCNVTGWAVNGDASVLVAVFRECHDGCDERLRFGLRVIYPDKRPQHQVRRIPLSNSHIPPGVRAPPPFMDYVIPTEYSHTRDGIAVNKRGTRVIWFFGESMVVRNLRGRPHEKVYSLGGVLGMPRLRLDGEGATGSEFVNEFDVLICVRDVFHLFSFDRRCNLLGIRRNLFDIHSEFLSASPSLSFMAVRPGSDVSLMAICTPVRTGIGFCFSGIEPIDRPTRWGGVEWSRGGIDTPTPWRATCYHWDVLSWSPDGKLLAAGGCRYLWLYDYDNPKWYDFSHEDEKNYKDLTWTPDGRELIICGCGFLSIRAIPEFLLHSRND